MFSPEDLERIVQEAVSEVRRLRVTNEEMTVAIASMRDELRDAEVDEERMTADLTYANERIRELSGEVERLKADLATRPPASPPPVQAPTDIQITIHDFGTFPMDKGKKDGREITYRGKLGEVQAVVDVKDDGQIRVSIERCWSDLAVKSPAIDTHLRITVDGKPLYDAPFRLHPHTCPPLTFKESSPPAFDLLSLVKGGFIPNYEPSARPSEATLVQLAGGKGPWVRWNGGGKPFDPVTERYSLAKSSWPPGANEQMNEAAMLNPAEVAFLLSRDPRAWALTLDIAYSSGCYPVHYLIRDEQGGHYPSAQETAGLPFLQTTDSVTVRTAAGVTCPIPDVAHMHSLAYLAALLTGDRYFRDQVKAWAAFALLNQKPDTDRLKGLLWTGQVRGAAWGLRATLHAALIARAYPDLSRHYLDSQLITNFDWMRDTIVDPKSPLHRPTGVTSVKPFRPAPMLDFVRAEPKPDYFATWNEEILCFVLDECVRAGFSQAAPMRDHVLKVAKGVWEHSPTVFDIGFGNHAAADTWPEIMRLTFEGRTTKPTAFAFPITQDYTAWFRAPVVVGARLGQQWAVEALAKLEPLLAVYKGGVPSVWRINPAG
jgi:hypothetical protein